MESKDLWLERLGIYDQQQFDTKIIYCCMKFNELVNDNNKLSPQFRAQFIERLPSTARQLLYNKSLMNTAEAPIVIEDDRPSYQSQDQPLEKSKTSTFRQTNTMMYRGQLLQNDPRINQPILTPLRERLQQIRKKKMQKPKPPKETVPEIAMKKIKKFSKLTKADLDNLGNFYGLSDLLL